MSNKGTTVFLHEDGDSTYECSECGKEFEEANDMWGSVGLFPDTWDFCPNCGRKIKLDEQDGGAE